MTVDNITHSRRITIRKKHQRKKRRENIRVENMSWQKNTESHSRLEGIMFLHPSPHKDV